MQKDEKTLQINGFVGFFVFLSLNVLAILRRGRFMNLPCYSIGIQLIILKYTHVGYELGNVLKRSLFDCQ